MRADFAALVQDSLPYAKRQFSTSTIGALRMRKHSGEYRLLKENAGIADQAMQTVWSQTTVVMRESDVIANIKQSFSERGTNALFHMVGASKNGAFSHHQTSDTILKQGDAMVVDLGRYKDGYVSDITRMMFLGAPSPEYLTVHQTVENAVSAALQIARPGILAKNVDAASRKVIDQAWYWEYFAHRLGHGKGSKVHEPPYLSTT